MSSVLFTFMALLAAQPAPAGRSQPAPPQADTGTATGPSFDCATATSQVMRLICGSPSLSQMDRQVANSYRAARATMTDPARIDANQQAWANRVNRCTDVACLETEYRARIAAFGQAGF